jgi:hypothetical protein
MSKDVSTIANTGFIIIRTTVDLLPQGLDGSAASTRHLQ